MKRIQQGFTLIELMIVVAIIGILAAVALPAYQDYTKRGRVTEGLALASGAKTAVTEYHASNNAFPSSNTDVGLAPAASITGNSVTSVTVEANGVVTIAYNSKVEDGKTIKLTPTATTGGIKWSCTGGDLNKNFRPTECR